MWFRDLRSAVRLLAGDPAFSLIAVGSLALGIGVNAATFGLADAILFRPLPVTRPSEVVSMRARVQEGPSGVPYSSISYRDYVDYRERARSFDGLVAHNLVSVAFAARPDQQPVVTLAVMVSGNFFDVLGVRMQLGRGLRPDEERAPGREPVAVLSYGTWVNALGADPDVVGRTVRLNGVDLTIVGVTAESFWGVDVYARPALYVPLTMAPALFGAEGTRQLEARDARGLRVKGRLRSGVSLAAADAEVATLASQLEQAYVDTNRKQSVTLRTELRARMERSPLDATIAALALTLAVLVLGIACANVASLLVRRGAARARELAVRQAVGAGRFVLARQILTENLVMALAGGVLGLLLAAAGARFFSSLPNPSDMPTVLDVRLDARVVWYSLAVSVGSVLIFGLLPALRVVRGDLVSALKAGDAGLEVRGRPRSSQVLVVAQVALSLVLLAATASLMRGLEQAALSGDPGFRREGLLLATFDASTLRYPPERTRLFYRELLSRARSLASVSGATLVYSAPLAERMELVNFVPEGYVLPEGRRSLSAYGNVVEPDYFETLGVPITRGRGFSEHDDASSLRVVIVNEELANRYWPGQDPVGKRLRLDSAEGEWAQVVGVAKTHKYMWIGESPTPFIYRAMAQFERQSMTLVVEAQSDPGALAAPVRELVRALEADMPMFDVRTMADFYHTRAVAAPRMLVQTVAAMGLIGLLLALAGLYGLMAYSVSRRKREIGVRMAVGADGGRVRRLFLNEGLRISLVGIVLGLLLSAGATPLLRAIVAGVTAADPLAVVGVPMALLGVAALATALPATRAARVDPVRALRLE